MGGHNGRGAPQGARPEQLAPEAPQDLDAEESVLGAILLDANALTAARETGLVERDFYREATHGRVYRVMCEMDDAGYPIDVVTLSAELERRGYLGDTLTRQRVHELGAIAPAALNVAHWAQIVRGKARRRAELAASFQLRDVSMNGGLLDKPELIERLRRLCEPDRQSLASLEALDLPALLASDVPSVDWLWGTWLARGDLALLVGDPGVGKSLLALGLSDSVRRGGSFLGEPCQRGRVGIIDLENPLSEVHKRLLQVGVRADSCDGLVYIHGVYVNLTEPGGVAALQATIEEHELDLVIIDSLRRAAPRLDENDSAQIASVFAPLRQLTATSGRSIVVIHHARKRIGDNPTDAGQMVRGSGDLVAGVDVLLYARGKEAGSFTLEHGKARRGFPHDTILVRIENESEDPTSAVRLVNEGPVAAAEDKVEAMLARIRRALAAVGGPLERSVLALRVESAPSDRTFQRALALGYDRSQLAKDAQGVGKATLYALAEGVSAE